MPAPPEREAQLQSESHDGVRLVLDHVAQNSNDTVFQVSLHYDQPNTWVGGPWGDIGERVQASSFIAQGYTPWAAHRYHPRYNDQREHARLPDSTLHRRGAIGPYSDNISAYGYSSDVRGFFRGKSRFHFQSGEKSGSRAKVGVDYTQRY